MLFTIITVFVQSIVMFFVWFIVVWAFSIVFWRSLFWKKHLFFIKILLLNSIIYFLGVAIPEQNKLAVSLIVIGFFFFLFWFLPKIRKKSEKFLSMNRKIIFVLFLALLMLLWKWEYLESSWSVEISDKINIWTNWEVLYRWLDITKSSIWFFNEYGVSEYDTIKYDINLDGFVDFQTVDLDEDGKIDETVISTYDIQKIRSFVLLVLFIIYCFIFSRRYSWFSNLFQELYERKTMKKIKTELDLGALKKEEAPQPLPLQVKEEIEIPSVDQGNIEEENKRTLNLGALQQVKKEEKIEDKEDNIDKDKDDDDNNDDNNHSDWDSSNTEVDQSNEGENNEQNRWLSIKKWTTKIVAFTLLFSLLFFNFHWVFALSYSEIQTQAIKYKNCWSDPFNPASCIWVNSEVRTFLKHMVNPTFIAESQAMVTRFRNCFEINKSTCSTSEQQKILLEYESWWQWWLATKPVNSTGKSSSNNILGWGKTKVTVKPQEIISTITETGKYISDVSGWSLKGMNNIVTNNLFNELKWVWEWNKINWQTIKQLEWMIEKWSGKSGLNVIDKIEELTSQLDSITWGNLDKYDEVLESFWKIKWWLWGAVKWIWALGTLFESYNDYKGFNKLLDWDSRKTFIATTGSTTGKLFISSNPVDFVLDISAGLVWLAGYDLYAKKIQEYTLGNRFKQTIEDAYTSDEHTVMEAIDQRASDFLDVYNDPTVWVIEKSYDFLEFSLTAWYWWIIAVTKAWIWIVDSAIDSYWKKLFGGF